MKFLWSLLVSFFVISSVVAQTGTAYGLKGGLTLGNQRWNNQERELLVAYHGAVFMESVNDSVSLALFGELGFHERGSAIRVRETFDPNTMRTFPARSIRQPFRNLSLILGVKNYYDIKSAISGFYSLGVRVDYTLDYDIAFQAEGFDMFVNDWNYGLTLGGGLEHELSNFPGAVFVELSISPDFSRQVFLPGNTVVYNIPGSSQQFTFPEQKVINLSFELSVGFKFIRRVEWID